MERVIDVINTNLDVINVLLKIGRVPLSLMNDYEIYSMYLANESEPEKMKRYEKVAKYYKVSVNTVRKAVREMEKKINP
jgi:hypothetical protein